MIALPSAPAAPPRRQLLVGTALSCAAIATMVGGMLALWMRFRDNAVDAGEPWLPKGVVVSEVATNVMLLAFVPICLFAQWAVYSARRDDRPHTGLALGLVALLGLAVINAQAYTYSQMKVAVNGGAYGSMFYAITGVLMLLLIAGVAFSAACAFRYLGGRVREREIITAHAFYWYFLAAVYAAVWFVVYVTK
jgi:heme/copper-type cytochrome/quinol oxidase subunit 3